MSILSTLSAADERLAAQLDKVADAVGGIGAATNAARKRLALALDAARARLTGALADVEAMAGELCADLLAAAGEDLLAVPESQPEPYADVMADPVVAEAVGVALDASHDLDSAEGLSKFADALGGVADALDPPAPVNRVSEAMEEAVAIDSCDAKEDAETVEKHRANGRPKKRRR